jgi:hypothetical protein
MRAGSTEFVFLVYFSVQKNMVTAEKIDCWGEFVVLVTAKERLQFRNLVPSFYINVCVQCALYIGAL